MLKFPVSAFVLVLFTASSAAWCQLAEEQELITALQEGGLVVVMRHASSPADPPDEATANSDNTSRERQLDANGRAGASAMGEALRRLRIPIGEILSSPAYRTVETARYLGFDQVRLADFLGNQGMQASSEAVAAALRENVLSVPGQGNRLLITHSPNVAAAFPDLDPTVEQGEVLVFDPQGERVELLGRIRIEQWPGF